MNKEVEKGKCAAWPAAYFNDRMLDCLLMLSLHGAITEAEKMRIKKRINKIVKQRKKA